MNLETITDQDINTTTNPVISVVTVVLNGRELIEKTIKSVLQQKYSHVQFVVIDGASTDGTLEIIDNYKHAVDIFISETDKGIYDAMNKGIRAATGDYLIFLNAGDVFASKNVLESVAKAVMLNEFPDVLYGETNIYTKEGVFKKKLNPLKFSRLNITLFGTRTVCHQSIFVKAHSIPPYDISYKLKGELCWYYDIFKKNQDLKAVLLPYPIANYLLGGIGEVFFRDNIRERLRVVLMKEGIFGCVIATPFLLIQLAFRLKQNLVNGMWRIKDRIHNDNI